MEISILVLLLVVIVMYYSAFNSSKTEKMTLTRYRPLMTGQPAPVDYDENMAGIPDPNSHEDLPNINQYANNLAFNASNPYSANYQMQGNSVLDPPAYDYLGNKNGDVVGRN